MDRFVILLLLFLSMQTIKFSLCSIDSKVVCIKRERQALLSFKQGLEDYGNWLSSWTGEDCCKWEGVDCDNKTGHVLNLNLGPGESQTYEWPWLSGEISPSLLELKHLKHLDLSGNDFNGIRIPEFLGSLKRLTYLNLSNAGFASIVPQQLGNLSSLRYLDLSDKIDHRFFGGQDLHVESFRWLSRLSSLRHLDMSGVYLSKASDYLQMMNMLPLLSELRLSHCSLGHIPALPIPYVNFTSLTVIDLSHNYYSMVPDWLMTLSGLVSVELSHNDFHGPIPDSLQNMTSLRILDLYWNNFNSTIPDWLYNFGSLVSLSLRDNNLQGTISSAVGNLTSLTSLDLSSNELTGGIPTNVGNLCHLRELHLSMNKLSGEIYGFLGSSSRCIANGSLEVLALSENQLSGHLPSQLGQLRTLHRLYLGFNSFSSTIPASIGRLTSLSVLDVGGNQLNGTIPKSLGYLSELRVLNIYSNSLEGVVSEVHFANLTRLKALDASSNSLILQVRSDWIPPFNLRDIKLGSWRLGPQFPEWLRTQKDFSTLNFSRTGISDKIPTWFWNSSSEPDVLDLSWNQIHGEIPSVLNFDGPYYTVINLESNRFSGPLPSFLSQAMVLIVSNNSFSGSISHFLCKKMNETSDLQILDLSYNLLSGELPECWENWRQLIVVMLGNNNFSGNIPRSMGSLSSLRSLHLYNNNLSGELPPSLQKCTYLMTIDLRGNKFSGSIPTWVGKSFPNLLVLNLRSNNFSGIISPKHCGLTSLQVLDLAHNNLSGTIPQCFNNFSAMAKEQNSSDPIDYFTVGGSIFEEKFEEKASLVIKGSDREYSSILKLLVSMDLSVNHLYGEIPQELTTLSGLRSLNLSGNDLSGKIPRKIGDMLLLESLDLSMNKLSGEIPQSMSNLTFLSILNLSYNHFSGKIPLSTQFQSFSATSFIGNLQLCGPPLTERCNENGTSNGPMPGHNGEEDKGDQEFEGKWFGSSMAFGFVLGFWGIWGPLLFSKSWRFSYFLFLSDTKDKLFYHLM